MTKKPKYCIVFDRDVAYSRQNYILDWLEKQNIKFETFDTLFGDVYFSVYYDMDLVKINVEFKDWIIDIVEL